MKFALIGGNHPRHLYYLNAITDSLDVVGALIEWRENILPNPPERLSRHDEYNWLLHFGNRADKEREYFGDPGLPQLRKVMTTHPATLNRPQCADFIQSLKPDAVLVFGSGMIRPPLYDVLPLHTYNMHLGLSPRYRGAATLFWPQYFLEPAWAGVTFHRIVHEPDAGDVVHQCRPSLMASDTIHDVACTAVKVATEEAFDLFSKLDATGDLTTHKQTATGKNFLASDFQPAHLRQIYDVWDDRIAAAYLNGEIEQREPKMYQQVF